jgi:hypothetical protein
MFRNRFWRYGVYMRRTEKCLRWTVPTLYAIPRIVRVKKYEMEGTWNSHGIGDNMWKVLIWKSRGRHIEDYGHLGKERVWTVDSVLNVCVPPAATHFLPCGHRVCLCISYGFQYISYCSYFPEKHWLVSIMETDLVHGALRIKSLYRIWKNFSQTSLWEICGGQSSNGKVFSPSFSVSGMRWRIWLRHCATSRKVAGSIPDVIDIVPAALWPWARLSS